MEELSAYFDTFTLQSQLASSRGLMLKAVEVLGERRRDMEIAADAMNLAENEYQNAKAIRSLELKAEGHPVTLIEMVIRGEQGVAEARLARDAAKTIYDRAKAAHYDALKAADIYETDCKHMYGLLTRSIDSEKE